jgi:hypothetical protein
MSTPTTDEKPTLDKAIENLLAEMAGHDGDSDEFSKCVDQLAKLYDIKKSIEKDNKKIVSYDQLLAVAGNLAGILLILNFERAGVVTTKALSFVSKIK